MQGFFFSGEEAERMYECCNQFHALMQRNALFSACAYLLLINVRQQGDLLGRTLSTPRASHVGPSSSQERLP